LATDSSTCRSRLSRRSARAGGPTRVAGSSGSPTGKAAVASTSRRSNSSATVCSTMNRLAAMQLWPPLENRARAAWEATFDRSASASTRNGSEPPSSSTHFLTARPAAAPTAAPARSLPVSVTALRRGSLISRCVTSATEASPTSRARKRPAGAPAAASSRSMARAHWGTLGECFRSAPLPAIRAGAANRSTCQNGKFQGMMARTRPSGW
jgi:hypothetical protein